MAARIYTHLWLEMQRFAGSPVSNAATQQSTVPGHTDETLTCDFDYELPKSLIAQYPARQRSASRLLVVNADGHFQNRCFSELPSLLRPNDVLVFNDTRVIPGRLYGYKESGGKVEILLERILNQGSALVQIKASKSPKPATVIRLRNDTELTVESRHDDFYRVRSNEPIQTKFEQHGLVPLPPYISRAADERDKSRYQTVYAKRPGAVAAPTAGLHFDRALLNEIDALGVRRGFLTLHVGSGTFQPVRTEHVLEHKMHGEIFSVDQHLVDQINQVRKVGGRVIAVGTTTVRALESVACEPGGLVPTQGETHLFIAPGYPFQVVDALITNFHLPRSTLLMMVCALGGKERVLCAYEYAVRNEYRFYSYGDAMWIERPPAMPAHAV